jgi:hypothetical protein
VRRSPPRGTLPSLLALTAILLCACGGTAHASAKAAPEAPCAANTASTVADAAGSVARRIYIEELYSPEVTADRRQVEGNSALLSALDSGNGAAVTEAVTRLVYSGTHIVRLRVIRHGHLLADVGGPYIIAPVTGVLRASGRVLAQYVLSVQDDLGYVKLETRFIGVPLLLLTDNRRIPLEGTIVPGSSQIPASGPVRFHGTAYESYSFTAKAFPQGTLRVLLLVPAAPPSGARCAIVRAAEIERIAHTAWDRFRLVKAPPSAYVLSAGGLIDSPIYVRSGSRQLAGTTSPGPRHLPARGPVDYRGRTYQVRSFLSTVGSTPVRVYALIR